MIKELRIQLHVVYNSRTGGTRHLGQQDLIDKVSVFRGDSDQD